MEEHDEDASMLEEESEEEEEEEEETEEAKQVRREEELEDEVHETESGPEVEEGSDANLAADSQMQDLDTDKDGFVTLKEFKADHEKEAYYKAREQEIASVFAKNDKNKDDQLDKQEMRSADQEMLKLGM